MQCDNGIWPGYAILQNRFFYKNILQKMWPGN